MSEKIRPIKKEPLGVRVGAKVGFSQKRTKILFLAVGGAVVLAPLFYFSFKYIGGNDSSISASISGEPSKKAIDKNLVATICRSEECFWINKDGFAFGKSGKTGGNLVLSFEDKTGRELKTDTQLIKPETLAELLFLRKRISEDLGVYLKNGETSDLNLNDFNFTTADGWILKLSIKENAYQTIEILKQTLEEIKKTAPLSGLDYVDLRISNKVFYKFK